MKSDIDYPIGNFEAVRGNYRKAFQRLKSAERKAQNIGSEQDKFMVSESLNMLEWKVLISEQERLLEKALKSNDWNECLKIGDRLMPDKRYIPNILQDYLYAMRKYHAAKAYYAVAEIAGRIHEPVICNAIRDRYVHLGMLREAKLYYDTGRSQKAGSDYYE